jgi:hypothetical protein
MRYMIIVKGNAVSESGALPDPGLMAGMARFHEELARAGVLLDANGLRPTSEGWKVRWSKGRASVVDGPFAGTGEPFAGYTLIQVRTPEEAREWARRFPAPFGPDVDGEIEVRRLYELDDFVPGPAVDAFRAMPGNGRPA